MSQGQLSDGQRRYSAALRALVPLDETVVRAWIGAESGWNATKGNNNYLNVMRSGGEAAGPRTYASPEAGGAGAARVLAQANFSSVRATVGRPGIDQIEAIAASPWDAGRYGGDGSRLRNVYRALAGGQWPVGVTGSTTLPVDGGIVDTITGAAGDAAAALNPFSGISVDLVLTIALWIALVAMSQVLMLGGLYLATVRPVRQRAAAAIKEIL